MSRTQTPFTKARYELESARFAGTYKVEVWYGTFNDKPQQRENLHCGAPYSVVVFFL